MCLPAIHELRRGFPEAALTLLLKKELEPLIEGHPDLDRLLPWNPAEGQGWTASLRWAGEFRKERFDAVIVFNPTRLFHLAAFLAGIPLRIGYRRKLGFLLTRSIPDTKVSRVLHEMEYNVELVRLFGISTSTPLLSLPKRPESEAEAARILDSYGIPSSTRPIAFHPWTSDFAKTRHRRWPLESFQDLATNLHACGQPVLVVGGQEFRPLMDQWKAKEAPGIIDLVGRVPLRTLPALLRRCAVLISNDSGPAHIAVAVGTPTIVVASKSQASTLNRWGPRGPRHRILLSPTVEEAAAALRACLAETGLGAMNR